MLTYTIRNTQTGQSYDLPLERDISTYTEQELDRMVALQDAQRAADLSASRAAVAQAAALPRGSAERSAAMQYQPLEIPSIAQTTAMDLGAALSRIAPDSVRSALMINAGLTPGAAVQYGAEAAARAATGQPMANPVDAMSRYMAGARRTPVYQGLEDVARAMRDFYTYDRTNVPEEQQAISEAIGGGVGSALGYAATIPTGIAGLLPLALGQSVAPTAEKYLDQGVPAERAIPQALIGGGIEAGSEFVLGVPGKIARRLGLAPQMAKVLKPIADNVDRVVKSWVGEVGAGMAQEGVEEMISGLATDLSAAYLTGADPNAMDNMLDKRIQEFIGGAIGGAVIGPAARQARQIHDREVSAQQRIDLARKVLQLREELKALIAQRTEAQRLAELQRQGQPPVLPAVDPTASAPISGVAEAIARANSGNEAGPWNVAYGRRPPGQDLPYNLLQQIRLENAGRVTGGDQPTPGQRPPGQDLPYNLLQQVQLENAGRVTGGGAVPPGQPLPGQDLPYDLLASFNVSSAVPPETPAAPPAAPPVTPPAKGRAAVRRLKGAPPVSESTSIADLEARTTEKPPTKGTPDEEKGMQEGRQVTPASTGAADYVAPPRPEDFPPTQAELDEAAAVMSEPPYVSGLHLAKNEGDYVKAFRDRVKQIKEEPSAIRRSKAIGDLMADHQQNKDRIIEGKKSQRLNNLEVWAARYLAPADTAWSILELAIDSDLVARQAKWTADNLLNIGDPPDLDATPEQVEKYEQKARLPVGELAFTTPEDGSVAPWESPTEWLKGYLGTSHVPGEARQLTNRHVFIQLGDQIYLMPVYDQGKSTKSAGQRVMIGDPQKFFSSEPKFRVTANEFATRYLGRAKYLGSIRLPVGAGMELMNKTRWTPEEFSDIQTRLTGLQAETIRNSLYPAFALRQDVPESTEEDGGVDVSFMDQIAVREPAMAHIKEFISAFFTSDPPLFEDEKVLRKWVISEFERFINVSPDARDLMNQVVSIAMRSAIIRQTKAGGQKVQGMPLHVARNPEYAKRWFKDQLARAFIDEVREIQSEYAAGTGVTWERLEGLFGGQANLAKPQAGGDQRAVLPSPRQGVAGYLARRIAPGLGVSEQQLRERGLRTSSPSDYAATVRRLKKVDRAESDAKRGRVLSRLRARGEIQRTSTPVADRGRVKSDLKAIKSQVRESKKKVRAVVPDSGQPQGAPPMRWQKLKDSDGFDYWVAPWTPEFETWMKTSPNARKVVDAVRIRGAGSYFQTYANPSKFTSETASPKGEMAYQEAAMAMRKADSKKKPSDLRLSRARPIPEEKDAFTEEFHRDFSRVGGDAIRIDPLINTPVAVDITPDGRIVLSMSPKLLRDLQPEEWTAIWDEELRHTALLSFMRSRLKDQGFDGDVGARVAQDLAEAWSAIDGPVRQQLEDRLRRVYGRPLDDAQRTAELVRMIGQDQLTEGVTRRSLGQRFLDLIRDFAQWLRQQFKTMPQPIKEMVDGVEKILADTSMTTVLAQPIEDADISLRLSAAEPEARIDSQRISPAKIADMRASGMLDALAKRRLDEMEAVRSDLLDTPSRDLLIALETEATSPITPGLSAFDRRIHLDEKRSAGMAFSRLRNLRDQAELEDHLTTPSPGQQVMSGAAPTLTDDQKMEVMHDAVAVIADHERLSADLQRMEGALRLALRKEAMALKELSRVLGTNPDPASMKAWIKNRMNGLRSDVARAFELSNIATEKTLAHSLHQNIPLTGDRAALNAALSALGKRKDVEDLKALAERLSNDPQLADLSLWPWDEDAFYNQLVIRGVLGSVIASDPMLRVSSAVGVATTAPATGVRPPLQAWGQLRSTIESLQGYKDEHALALAELKTLAPKVDRLANIPRDQSVSYRRALNQYQGETSKLAVSIDRLSRYDSVLRAAHVARRGLERAIDVLNQTMQSRQYNSTVTNAVSAAHRRSNDVIYDVTPVEVEGKSVRLGIIGLRMPPNDVGEREILKFKLSFDMEETDAERIRLAKALADIENWLLLNQNADPVMVETYRAAAVRLEHFLSPNYAVSDGTINEAGLWGLLSAPMKIPIFRDYLHPVLKEIDDSAKGMTKGLLVRAIAPFVRWGLFEQGTKPGVVKIKATKAAGMASHNLVNRFRARDILDPFRMDREDDDYRWMVIEPILRSWQNSLGKHHIEAGDHLPDPSAIISDTGTIVVTKEDIEAARAQMLYEREIRNFTTLEGFNFGAGQVNELLVEEQAAGDLGLRSRLPFAAGPGVMSRSLAHKAEGRAMQEYRRAWAQVPLVVGSDGKVVASQANRDAIRNLYLDQTLRGRATSGITDPDTWRDVVLAHILETNPEFAIRENSKLVKVYNSIAIDIYKGNLVIANWQELVSRVADRMETLLGDTRPMGERLVDAEMTMAGEITDGMENIRTILDNQTAAAAKDVHILSPKSSFTTARGAIVGAPGLYEHGLHSDFAINALHGTVLRHVTNGVIKALAVMSSALDDYVNTHGVDGGANIRARKKAGKSAYYLGEAIALSKAIKDQLQAMEAFEMASRDPQQYYHDIMRWSSMLLVRPLVSAVINSFSVVKDTLLTVSVGATRQRRTLWGTVNTLLTTPKAMAHWLGAAGTVALASFAQSPGNQRLIKQQIMKLVPGLASAVHSASQRIAQARLAGRIRGVSLADESVLMRTSGSLLGVHGAMEWERTRPAVSRLIKFIDRVVSRVPGSKLLTYAIAESRTIAEDINAIMYGTMGDDDLKVLTRRAMQALAVRDRNNLLVQDPNMPGYALTEKELGLSFGGLRQARRWFEGSSGLDATMLAHYLAHRGKSLEEQVAAELPQGGRQAWDDNYLTETQVQTLRERPAVSYKKGLVGRVARMFTSLKVWSSNAFNSYIQGEILRTKVTKPFYTRMPEEIARMLAMLILLMVLGAPSVMAIDWLRDKLGRPQGLTIENLIQNPDLQSITIAALGIATQVIPMSSMFEEAVSGWGQGSIDLFRLAPVLSGAQGFYRAMATVASTANWSDPASVMDAADYQFKGLATRFLANIGMARGATNEGLRQYQEASRTIRKLAPSDVERSPRGQGRIPTSPAYDNVRRAVQIQAESLQRASEGKTEEAKALADQAEAEAEKGLQQIIDSGVEPDAARKKLQAAFSAQSGFRGGFERSLTKEEKIKTLERATPTQRASILNREAAVERLSGLLGKGRSSLAQGIGGGQPVRPMRPNRSGSKLAARLRSRRGRAAISPTRSFLRPIQIRTRKRRASLLGRLARLRRKAGLPQ
jgi:hypothetical protein